MTSALTPATTRTWRFPYGHRFTKSEMRRVLDGLNSYAYHWGLRGVSPFHEVKRANPASHTESGYNGWTLLYAEIKTPRLLKALEHERGGLFLPHWWALRASGFRPVCPESKRLMFMPGSVPLDYEHEIEPLATRRGIASISRWTWCRWCDADLAVTREGACESCAVAPIGQSADTVRPIGAPLDYVVPAGL